MRADAHYPVQELRVDGGACRSDLLMQFQADLLGVPVVRPAVTETTALGAAYLAGLAVGFWKSTGEIASQRQDRTALRAGDGRGPGEGTASRTGRGRWSGRRVG